MTDIDIRLRCLEYAARVAEAMPEGSVNTEGDLLAIAETFLAWVQEAPVEMPRVDPENPGK